MSYSEQLFQFRYMIEQVLDGTLPDEDIQRFNELIINDARLREYYCEYINITIGIERQCINLPVSIHAGGGQAGTIFRDLLKLEREAPAVETYDEIEVEEVVKSKNARKRQIPGKFFMIYNKLVSLAAVLMILFILYANVFPPKYSVPVGVVVDQMGLEWAKSSEVLKDDDVLFTNQAPYVISKGYLKLRYNEGVDVLIEGPASFEIDKSRLYLEYGKLYAHVSEIGKGFTVESSKTKFVDLGTEFGVLVDSTGSSELHVLKGEVQFYAGSKDNKNKTRKVYQDNAIRYDSDDSTIESIPINRNSFVRNCNSSSNFAWKGQHIDLADIIGGGNGFGTGKTNYGIDFYSGKVSYVESEAESFRVSGYVAASHPYIDGVFMPDGGDGSVEITSTGISFDRFPDTNGDCYVPVCNNREIKKGFGGNPELGYLIMNGEDVQKQISPRICLHSNAGITFDLDAIRSSLSGVEIERFTAVFGLIESSTEEPTDVDLFILVDGINVFSHKGYLSTDNPLDIKVELDSSDRFLTMTCLEGMQNFGDWAFLVNPILELKSAEY